MGYRNCVVPCPSIEYTASEWNRTVSVLQVLCFLACSLSGIVFCRHIWGMNSKRYIRTMFIGGFFASSTILTVFLFANMDNSITCSGAAHYVETSYLCVLQAFCLIFTFTWVVSWSVIFSFDVYNHIVSLSPTYDSSKYHLSYTWIALIISTTLSTIPLAAGKDLHDVTS